VATLQITTVSAVARDALSTILAGLLGDAVLPDELPRRKAELGRGEEA
jgi:hypothetical protein